MSQPLKTPLRRGRALWLKIIGALTVVLVLGAALVYWLVVPGIAERVVRQQLDRVGTRLGVEVETGSITTSGWQGVVIDDFVVRLPGDEQPLLHVATFRASLDKTQLLTGATAISFVALSDVELRVVRHADGSLSVDPLLARVRDGKDDDTDDTDDSTDDDAAASGPGFLRYFGGQWPDLQVERATLVLEADEGAEPWPATRVHAERFDLAGARDSARATTVVELTRGAGAHAELVPEKITVDFTLRSPFERSTGHVDFEPAIELTGVGPYPYLRGGISGLTLEADNQLELRGLSLAIDHGSYRQPVATVGEVRAKVSRLSRDVREMRLLELSVDKPAVVQAYDARGAGSLETLHHMLRAPAAGHIRNRAAEVAAEVAAARPAIPTNTVPPADVQPAAVTPPTPAAGRGSARDGIDWTRVLGELAPQKVTVTGASLTVQDRRHLATLTRPSALLAMTEGKVELTHRPLAGELSAQVSFLAEADGRQPRGMVELDINANYRSGALEASTTVDALDLSWVAQLGGPRIASKLHGGTLRTRLSVERPSKTGTLGFNGTVSLEDGQLHLPPIAEDPIRDLTGSYTFEGTFDPKAPVPAMKLGRRNARQAAADDAQLADDPLADAPGGADVELDPGLPPTRGALVFTTGQARLGNVKADVRPALFGIDGRRMPARFDLTVALPATPLSELVNAVPDALKGPLAGLRMTGTFAWDFALEVPLYEASAIQWDTRPQLENLEIVHLPPAVDVFKMTGEFRHTIRDEFERTTRGKTERIEYEREVKIGPMTPIPAPWLLENTNLTLEQIDRERRRREWPPVPGTDPSISYEVLRSPEYWLTDHAISQAAPKPWKTRKPQAAVRTPSALPGFEFGWGTRSTAPEPEPEADEAGPLRGKPDELNPYGPYVFVPLHHTAPWLVRAIVTTEDNSFFTHGGFNWLALKQSVEANLRAGRYVRGASTISMQLAKNLFLDRSKVLSRKLQEVFIVWLMEDVADIPKERMMEIYLNIIEFGPGVFGIHDASVHYFGKHPDELTLSEVAWLVSIVPSPKRYHVYFERGAITDAYFRRMMRYVRVMHSRERITEEQLLAANEDRPEFYKPEPGTPLLRPLTLPRAPDPAPALELEAPVEDEPAPFWPRFQNFFE